MKQILFWAVIGSLFYFGECNKPTPITEETTVELNFKATINDQPMIILTDIYPYAGQNIGYTISGLRFFISNVKLLKSSGEEVLTEIDAVDFYVSNSTSEGAEKGVTLSFKDVPPGDYTGLTFGIGVPENLNNISPADQPSTSILNETNHLGNYWEAWNSYIFAKFEGKIDVNNNGSVIDSGVDLSYLYHTGVNGQYQTVNLTKGISVEANKKNTLEIELQCEKLFGEGSATIDILNDNFSHSGDVTSSGYQLALKVVQNMANAFKLKN